MKFRKHLLWALISTALGGERWQRRLAVCTLFVAAAATLAQLPLRRAQAQAQFQPQTDTLHGKAALERLKQEGHYDSLQVAMEQARLAVSQTAQTPLGRAAWHAPNRAAGYDAYVTESGVSIAVSDKSVVSLQLQGLGYGQAMQAVGTGEVSGDKQTISLVRQGGIREWFVNTGGGLEHGFTLTEPPGSREPGVPLRLTLQVGKGWQAEASDNGQLVTLFNGRTVVEYGKLIVRDKLGCNISARLTVADGQVVIEVDESGAVYPLTIDPLFTLQRKLLAADGAASDTFGRSVALSGNTAVVGAPEDDVTGVNQGTVYVFVRNGASWNQQARLNALDGATNDYFGNAVALSGDTLVVGASEDDFGLAENQGAVYVFTRNGTSWTQQQKIIANDGAAGDRFGFTVALGGDTLVIGAHWDDVGTHENQGSVYVFTQTGTTWTQQQKLTADDGATESAFGYSVALDQDTLVVGASGDTIGTKAAQGSVYVFTRSGTSWTQQPKITASDGAASDQFGYSVAIGGDTLVVGAPTDSRGTQANQGSVYVFVRNGVRWTQQQQLNANDGAAGDQFGCVVALSGDLLVAGARFDDIALNNEQGSAYIFARYGATWSQQRRLVAGDGRKTDIFGVSVALHRDTVLVGASLADAGANDQGAVYAFIVRDNRQVEQQRPIANDAAEGDQFGLAVALSGDTLAVGSSRDDFGEDTDQGSVYVFTRSGTVWTLQQKLTALDAAQGDEFGVSVALSGDVLVVGAHQDDSSNKVNPDQGSAYVFTRIGAIWSQQQKLLANDGTIYDRFGTTVAVSGDTIAVGAPHDRVGMNSLQGSVYIFMRNAAGWAQQQQLTANDGAASNYFGTAIALEDDTLIVGADTSKVGTNNQQGAAYVFTRTGALWKQQQKLLANDGTEGDRFGSSVALSEGTAIIGAVTKSLGGNGGFGAAYIFVRNGTVWAQQQRLTANDGAEALGYSVTLNGDTALIGAVLSDVGDNVNQGAAYVFTRAGTVWTQQQKLIASDGTDFDEFGRSVASSGDTLIVGANGYGPNINSNLGAAYVFVSTACPTISLGPDSLPDGVIGASYQQVVTATGGTAPHQFALASGVLPPGLTLSLDGLLSGTPMTSGTYRFTLTATNANSFCAGNREYTMTVTAPCPSLTFNPPALPGGAAGIAYNQKVTATGGAEPYHFALSSGALPPGVSLNIAGVLSGTPTQAGIYNFTITAESNGCTGAQPYSLAIKSTTVAPVSAASYKAEAAPESIVAVFGVQMAEQTKVAAGLPLPTELAGLSVRVRDSQGVERLAPLFFVSPGQINLQIPAGTAAGMATIKLSSGATGQLAIARTAASVFTANADGRGVPAAVYLVVRNGVTSYEPVARFDGNRYVPEPVRFDFTSDQIFLVLYGTGLRFGAEVTARIGGLDANVAFAGAAPGFAGLDQVNVQIPYAVRGRGELDVVLYVERTPANPVLIQVR